VDVKIIDDFLPESLFLELYQFTAQIKWINSYLYLSIGNSSSQYSSEMCDNIDIGIPKVPEIHNNQFVYPVFEDGKFFELQINKNFVLHFVEYLEDRLNSIQLLKMKFNLTVPLDSQYTFGWHKDIEHFSHIPAYKTAILYLNENDGYTALEDGTKINSIANRLVIFNGNTYHAPVNATNIRNRLVLNINYLEGES
jgi:hypothetical protein